MILEPKVAPDLKVIKVYRVFKDLQVKEVYKDLLVFKVFKDLQVNEVYKDLLVFKVFKVSKEFQVLE